MKLTLIAGSGPQSVELDDQPLTIGRRLGNRVMLDDTFASARHATISLLGRHYVLEDLHSSNGTFLNDARIAGPRPLKPGDRIRVGKAIYELSTGDAGTAAPAPAARVPSPAPRPPAVGRLRTLPPASRPVEPEDNWRFEATQILTADLVPMAPAVAEKPSKAPIEFELRLPDEPGATRAPQPVDLEKLAAEDPTMLDAYVDSLKSQREEAQRAHDEKRAQLLDQWCKVVAYAERLKVKVGGDPRIKYFRISGRYNDITIRVQRTDAARLETLYISFVHPDRKDEPPTGIWFRRSGVADVCYPAAEGVNRELVRYLAFAFAAT